MDRVNMSRRSFVATAAASAAIAASASLASADEAVEAAASWRDEPATPEVASTESADVIVIGAGGSGLTCAASALDGGASVIVLEAGNGVQSSRSWIGAVDSKLQKEAGAEIDHNEAMSEICRYASYVANAPLIKRWADESGEFMDWFIDVMESQDLHVMLETACKDSIYYNKAVAHHVYQGEYSPDGVGNIFYHHNAGLQAFIEGRGGDIRFKTRAYKLVQDESGKVTGVIAANEDGTYTQFDANKGVVVATGGFGNNEEMLEELTNTAHRYCSMNLGADRNLGDGMKMLTWAGATLHPVQETMVFDRGTVTPDTTLGFPFTGGLWYGGSQPFLRVNTLGKRFFNEDQTYDYCFNAAIAQPGHTWWQVFDKNFYADAERFQTARCSRIAAPLEGQAPMIYYVDGTTPLNEEFMDGQLAGMLSSGAAVQADTIEELAELMGVPTETFVATVERYNELNDLGVDEDFGKKAFRLSAIAEPPFYAVHNAGWLLCTIGGVNVNTDSQPLDEAGNPIEGVYVVGNDQGGFFGTVYPETFGGLCNGRGMTFGYLVGKALALA